MRFLALLLATVGWISTTDASERPNIVFLLADDLGWTGIGCFGSDFYETPNLDRMAQQGMRLTNAYAACTVCSPTRASIMTGQYPARLRLTDFISGQNRPYAAMSIPDWTKRLERRHITIAERLKQAGYHTAAIGKWHLAPRGPAHGFQPTDRGFDEHYDKPPGTRGYTLPADVRSHSGSDYLTDYLTDRAVEFIERRRDAPFFLYFAYHVPHTPIEGRQDYIEYFAAKVRDEATHDNPVYAAMVKSLDDSAGRVLEALQRNGLADKTLVIFTSDNGGLTQRYGKHDGFTENLPLRRGKGSAYEGGVRVPTIVRWPGVVAAASQSDTAVVSIDYYPTLLAAAAIDTNPDTPIDGVDLLPLLKGGSLAERDLFWHYPHYHAGGDWPYSAVRSGDWRLIESLEDGHLELYDLARDIGESNNLVETQPRRAAQLLERLRDWRTSVDAQMPTTNPNHDLDRATQVGRGD